MLKRPCSGMQSVIILLVCQMPFHSIRYEQFKTSINLLKVLYGGSKNEPTIFHIDSH